MFKFIHELKSINSQNSLSRQQQADLMSKVRLPKWLEFISSQTIWMVVTSMWLGSAYLTFTFFEVSTQWIPQMQIWQKGLVYGLTPAIFAFSFVTIGGVFAQIGRFGELAGKFPRLAGHPIYSLRRIYGTAWSQVFYFKPLYAAFLAIPQLKKYLFRIYGFKGSTDFTVYPDSWIRDLPLLKIGAGAYLANRCTIGTNVCLADGSIIVGPCQADEKSMVGHLVIFGLGCVLGKSSELGISSSLGIRVLIKENAVVAPKAMVYHGVEIGNKVKIGPWAYVGIKTVIADEIEIKSGAIIPNGSVISSQADADKYFSSETNMMKTQKEDLTQILRNNLDDFHPRNS